LSAFIRFSVLAELIAAPAFAVPLETCEFVTLLCALLEAGFPVPNRDVRLLMGKVTLRFVFPATQKFGAANIVDAVAPERVLLGIGILAIALCAFVCFSILSIFVSTKALPMPLKTCKLVSLVCASLETSRLVTYCDVGLSVRKIAGFLILPASQELSIGRGIFSFGSGIFSCGSGNFHHL